VETQEPLDFLELRAAQDSKEIQVHRDSQVHKVALDVQDRLEQLEYRV